MWQTAERAQRGTVPATLGCVQRSASSNVDAASRDDRPPRTKRLIARAASESGLTTSEYVRMAIHRKLWQDALNEARRVVVPRARAKGIFTDEDVFALIS